MSVPLQICVRWVGDPVAGIWEWRMFSRLPSSSAVESVPKSAVIEQSVRPVPVRVQGRPRRRALMVGGGKNARQIASYLNQHPLSGIFIHGFLDAQQGDGILGRVDELSRVALAEFADEVIIAEPCRPEVVQRVVNEAIRLRLSVRVIPNLFGMDPKVVAIERLGDLPMLKLREQPVPKLGMFLKGLMDRLLAVAALLLLAPVFAAVALAIVIGSGRPVFYRAWRVGQKGKRFVFYKFRTMVADADVDKPRLRRQNERQGPVFKMACDPRITRVGRWLRRYSLDELPQLWNVLRGEMSLVGPRPHTLDDCERYELEHLRRLGAKPGMTGLWQVTARNDPSFQRNLALDLEYMEGWSLALDARILWKTIAAVLQGSGE